MASPCRPASEPRVPNLPGFSVAPPPAASYAKKQTLSYKNGYAVPVQLNEPDERAMAGWAIPALPAEEAGGAAAAAQPFVPRFVALDKQVLRYFGWFQEQVPDSPLEAWRVRKVCVLVYLEDGSMQVTEPSEHNSGLVQGTLVRRQKLPKDGGGVLGIRNLAVGGSLRIYGREVHIADADAFTREWAAGQGLHLAPARVVPPSPIEEVLAAKSKPSGLTRADADSPSKFAEALLGREFVSKGMQQFLQHGGEVLRFYLLWEGNTGKGAAVAGEEQHPGTDSHKARYKLHYFVADSTAEIMEVPDPLTGVALFPTFLKRGPLPKVRPAGALPGQARLAPEDIFAPGDLRIGTSVEILGRRFLIHDCDAATRKWYTEHLGFAPELLAPIDVSEAPKAAPKPELPPYNPYTIGSLEDTMQNCLRLVPKPPKKDQFRWQQLDHVVFRYEASLLPPPGRKLISIDAGRRFVVSFFLADQTLAVFEPPQPNTGITGGKFLERGRIYKPGSALEWFTEKDLAVGATLELHGRRFLLTGCDQYTQQYRAQHG